MNITLHNEPFLYVQIDNTYTEDELRLIFLELEFINSRKMMKPPEETFASKIDGSYVKKGSGLILDLTYTDRNLSNILACNRKLYNLNIPNILGDYLKLISFDTTLVNYYDDGEYYNAHRDDSTLTAITILFQQPKVFTGGELNFPTYNHTVECVFNRTYIFPGPVPHSVTNVSLLEEYRDKGLGRYTINNFMCIHNKM
jgi:Rps23 Pro-64 3,4-dihydroxylase Tpa1-like proline 4-hydroxylase